MDNCQVVEKGPYILKPVFALAGTTDEHLWGQHLAVGVYNGSKPYMVVVRDSNMQQVVVDVRS